ncbi:hypothetical protein RvY_09148 [Ramazzottius varieornatus]|uniref:Uncharacterized protein n=1 Tax=Ramazzottius varieornatus TaxID=947166 RepID=A0A1D1VAL1_RAMVA|nr:hypothetical protein RvY_09148 [Ramazzottius varieornatus]
MLGKLQIFTCGEYVQLLLSSIGLYGTITAKKLCRRHQDQSHVSPKVSVLYKRYLLSATAEPKRHGENVDSRGRLSQTARGYSRNRTYHVILGHIADSWI